MNAITEDDLKELRTLIENQGTEINHKLDKLTESVNDLRVDIATLKSEVSNNNKRLDNIDFILGQYLWVLLVLLF